MLPFPHPAGAAEVDRYSVAARAFVEAMGGTANFYDRQYGDGNRSVIIALAG